MFITKQVFIVSRLNSDINKGSVNKYNNITLHTDTHTHTFNTTGIPELARKFLGVLIKLEIQNSKFKLNLDCAGLPI